MVSATGVGFAILGVLAAVVLTSARLGGADIQAGVDLTDRGHPHQLWWHPLRWASWRSISVSRSSMAMGKPPYLIVSDPADGPLGRLSGPSSRA